MVRLSEIPDDMNSFYGNAGMYDGTTPDISVLRRETFEDDERRFQFTKKIITGKNVLDFGCGDGGYLLRAKNVANDICGVELERELRDILNSEDIRCYDSIDNAGQVDVITMFHVLEHLPNPIEMLKKISSHLSEEGQIIIEVPNANDALLSLYDCQSFADFTYWICHVYLYSTDTLRLLIKKADLKLNYIKQVQRYPLANHLHWLTKGKPGGHFKWSFLCDEDMDKQYGQMLANLGIADTIIASVSKQVTGKL